MSETKKEFGKEKRGWTTDISEPLRIWHWISIVFSLGLMYFYYKKERKTTITYDSTSLRLYEKSKDYLRIIDIERESKFYYNNDAVINNQGAIMIRRRNWLLYFSFLIIPLILWFLLPYHMNYVVLNSNTSKSISIRGIKLGSYLMKTQAMPYDRITKPILRTAGNLGLSNSALFFGGYDKESEEATSAIKENYKAII